jgi:serine/threonine-protein kinase/endoribonuclease IRE1
MDQLFLEDGHPKKFTTQMPSDKNVLVQLAEGLDYIHSTKQLIHGDIRPENVLIFNSPRLHQAATVKWAGFGLFKSVNKDGLPFPVSKLKGSMNWMAPELLNLLLSPSTESTAVVDQVLADIYSAGCTFFFYLSRGRHPYGNHSMSILSNTKLSNPVNAKGITIK